MNRGRAVARVTAWEFLRFLKVRDLVTTVVITAGLGLLIPLVIELVAAPSTVTLAVVDAPFALPASERFEFEEVEAGEAAARLEAGEVDGVVHFSSPEAATLEVDRERNWVPALTQELERVALPARIERTALSAEEYARLAQPLQVTVQVLEERNVTGGAFTVSVLLGGMLLAVFMGTGTLFTAITGEKTQRVTEQVVSAISPQAWIDGKVYGTMLYVIVNMLALGVGILIVFLVPALLRGQGLALPEFLSIEPAAALVGALFAVAGGVLYFFLFAAMAATIDDPNTSSRSSVIMLPGVFVGLGFLGLIGDPSNVFFRVLSYVPLTSPGAMPVRVVLGDAGALEVVLSLLLLVATCLLARRAAGKIFSLGILMSGKEPSFAEMLTWLRRA